MKNYLLHFTTNVLKVILSCRCKNVFCFLTWNVELQGLGVRRSFKTGLKTSSEWWLAGVSRSQEAGVGDIHHTKTFSHKYECAVLGSHLAHLARIHLTVVVEGVVVESWSFMQSERGSTMAVPTREWLALVGVTALWVSCPECMKPGVSGVGHWVL